jgi:hypothetical protein
MPIMFRCPSCRAKLRAQEADAGRPIACPTCGKRARVPDDDEALVIEPACPQKKGPNTPALVALVGGLVLLSCCTCGGGFFLIGLMSPRPPAEQDGEKAAQPQPVPEPAIPQPKDEPRPLSDPVTIQFEVEVQADRRAHVRGRTNLPPNTQLGVTVEEDRPAGFRGSVSIHVAGDGSFQGGPFGPANGLPDGVYRVQVVMPIPQVQPAPVRKVIGEQGEHLQGPLVEKGKLGVTVWARDKFTVGKGAVAQRERLLTEARQYEQLLEELDSLYKRLESARQNNLPKDLAKWGAFARQFNQDLEGWRDRMLKIPDLSARSTIGTPWGDLLNLFHATAFKKEGDYTKFHKLFREGMEGAAAFVRKLKEAANRD